MEWRWWVQSPYEGTAEWAEVYALAEQLVVHLDRPEVAAAIDAANMPGNSSAMVQRAFLDYTARLDFVDERKGLFVTYESALRPDYFCRLGETGVILEVERGKTTINNMDLLDFWKCHICEHAHYLFLMVPLRLVQNTKEGATVRREYETVKRRLGWFFRPENYTNVRGLVLIGY